MIVSKKKIFLLFLSVNILLNSDIKNTEGTEYSLPNNGSPYVNLGSLKPGQIVHIPTGLMVSKEDMINSVSSSRVIYVAETHDNLESHNVQLQIIKDLYKKLNGNIAVGMEMFRRSAQGDLNRWKNGELSQFDFLRLWYDNWGEGYNNYREILNFLKEKKIDLIALKPSINTELSFKDKKGSSNHIKDDTKLPDMDDSDIYHKAYANAIFGGHSKEGGMSHNPYNTLLLWEETMAETVSNFITGEGINKTLIVLAGGFHIEYGFGIPKRAYRRSPHNYSIVLPVITEIANDIKEGRVMTEVKTPNIPLYIGDYGWGITYSIITDKNAILGVSLKSDLNGLFVSSVSENSNAKDAGILNGDIIQSLDSQVVSTIGDLKALLMDKKVGDTSIIKILREKKEIDLNLTFKKY